MSVSSEQHGRYHVIGLLGGQAQFSIPDLVLNGSVMQGFEIGSLGQLNRLVKLMVEFPVIIFRFELTLTML